MSRVGFLYFMAEGLDETVIDSQVVDSIAAVAKEEIVFDLLALTTARMYLARRNYYRGRAAEVAARTGGRVRVAPLPRKHGRVGAALAATRLLLELRSRGVERLLVHARTDLAAYYAGLAASITRRIRYVFDARGDAEAEYLEAARGANHPPARVEATTRRLRRVGALAAGRAEHVLCVSSAMRDRLAARHRLDPARVTVVPCVADESKFHLDEAERAATRRELGLEDRCVVVYAGRLGRWHCASETYAVARAILASDPAAFFLVLTPEVEVARDLASRSLPEGRYAIRSAAHAEVSRILRAADLALLLREPDPLNEVACPTKFAEYVMSGLPVLISAGIGDCSRFVEEHAAGAVFATPDPARAVEAVRRLRAEPGAAQRARIAASARVLSRQRYAGELARIYRRIAEAP